MWVGGDFYKLFFYLTSSAPIALVGTASYQLLSDLIVFCQFLIFGEKDSSKEKGK